MSRKLVEIDGLKKTFRIGFRRRKIEALRAITFDVREGEILGLIGPNGAGKTTTMKVLTGLVTPDEGTARLFGEPVDRTESRRRLGYLPENPYFYDHLRAPELLYFYGHLFGIDRKTLSERVDRLIERVGLSHATDRPLRKFSKGMRQRAGLAQALINDPEFVILDEPQSGLDPNGRKDVRDLIFGLKQEGKTILFSSHILPDVEAICDRVVVIHEGRVVHTGTVSELSSDTRNPIEIIVDELSTEEADDLEGLSYRERRGDKLVLRFLGERPTNELVSELLDRGAHIHSVTPQKEGLEEIFVRDTQASRHDEPQGGNDD